MQTRQAETSRVLINALFRSDMLSVGRSAPIWSQVGRGPFSRYKSIAHDFFSSLLRGVWFSWPRSPPLALVALVSFLLA